MSDAAARTAPSPAVQSPTVQSPAVQSPTVQSTGPGSVCGTLARLVTPRTAAAASSLAALLHLLAVPEHLRVSWPAAGFLVVVAAAQLWLARSVRGSPGTTTMVAGLTGTMLVVATFVTSRTVGLPPGLGVGLVAGPLPPPEHLPVQGGIGSGVPVLPHAASGPASLTGVGPLELGCLGAELVVVTVLTGLLPERLRGTATNALLAVGAAAWVAWAVGTGR